MTRWRLGDEAVIAVQCRNADAGPANPDAAPTLRIYDAASVLVETLKLPPKDRSNTTGLFEHFIRLDASYSVGTYSWRANWLASGVAGVAAGVLHVVAGGDADGAVEAAEWIDKRGSTHLLQQLSTEQYAFGDNPRL